MARRASVWAKRTTWMWKHARDRTSMRVERENEKGRGEELDRERRARRRAIWDDWAKRKTWQRQQGAQGFQHLGVASNTWKTSSITFHLSTSVYAAGWQSMFRFLSLGLSPHHPQERADSHIACEPVYKTGWAADLLSVFPTEEGPHPQKRGESINRFAGDMWIGLFFGMLRSGHSSLWAFLVASECFPPEFQGRGVA